MNTSTSELWFFFLAFIVQFLNWYTYEYCLHNIWHMMFVGYFVTFCTFSAVFDMAVISTFHCYLFYNFCWSFRILSVWYDIQPWNIWGGGGGVDDNTGYPPPQILGGGDISPTPPPPLPPIDTRASFWSSLNLLPLEAAEKQSLNPRAWIKFQPHEWRHMMIFQGSGIRPVDWPFTSLLTYWASS